MKIVKIGVLLALSALLLSCNLFLAPRKAAVTLTATLDGYVDIGGFRDFTGGTMSVASPSPGPEARALLKFAGIPEDTLIYSAELLLQPAGAASSATVVADRVTAAWDPGSVTFSQASAVAGEGSSEFVPMTSPPIEIPVGPIVQSWSDGEDNNGIVLYATSGNTGFATNESITGEQKPRLRIVYAD